MAPVKVALAGATGLLGFPILKALLAANHPVVVLTRKGSDSKSKLPSSSLIAVHEVDYKSASSIVPALKDVTVVICTLGSLAVGEQIPLVDAAASAGVKRFIPSEFGSDTTNPQNSHLPVYGGKVATQKHLQELSSQNPNFTYTFFLNNLFFDSGVSSGFIINPTSHTATLYDGGNVPISVTRLSTIASALVSLIDNALDETKNRSVFIHDTVTTQNALIDIVKSIDNKPWNTTVVDSAKLRDESFAELGKPNPDFGKAMVGFLPIAIYGKEGGGNFEGKTDNKLLGVKEMRKQEVVEMVRGIVEGKA
jgi:nucleoside-diphosphate-sugar epimerase